MPLTETERGAAVANDIWAFLQRVRYNAPAPWSDDALTHNDPTKAAHSAGLYGAMDELRDVIHAATARARLAP